MALPILPSKSVTLVSEEHAFSTPVKLIKTTADLGKWDKSEAYFEYLGFIYAINDAVRGNDNSIGSSEVSPNINKTIGLLDVLSQWIDEIPLENQPIPSEGNPAFRVWYNRLKEEAIELLQRILPVDINRAIPEIMVYFEESFGDANGVKYGVVHEIAFVMFLCALFKISFLKESDLAACACKLFLRYLRLVRNLQVVYNMQPAGSFGPWSLDDYQFVPFIWGSAQLIGNREIHPTMISKPDIADIYANDYLFMGCLKYINKIKSGAFAEHSHQLWSVSGVHDWSIINTGLIKMYRAEVLSRFTTVEHIIFGSLFTLKTAEYGASIRHFFSNSAPQRWSPSLCCNLNVPSSISQPESRREA